MFFPRQATASKAYAKLVLAVAVAAGLAFSIGSPVGANGQAAVAGSPVATAADVALSTLSPEARHTHALVLSGGPFPYQKDGSVFGNRERLLPARGRSYYREYTVKTPGARDRGARRIVCGGARPRAPDACYYTADHYASFVLVAQ